MTLALHNQTKVDMPSNQPNLTQNFKNFVGIFVILIYFTHTQHKFAIMFDWGRNSRQLLGLVFVLWHINHCRLFNAKSSLYIHIKYMICKHILLIKFLNERKLILCSQLNGSKYFYVSLTIQLNISHLSVKWSNSSFSKNLV